MYKNIGAYKNLGVDKTLAHTKTLASTKHWRIQKPWRRQNIGAYKNLGVDKTLATALSSLFVLRVRQVEALSFLLAGVRVEPTPAVTSKKLVCTVCGVCTTTKIPFIYSQKRNSRPLSQFPHSCVCERFIYSQSQDRSTYFPAAE
jgi:hypothetical protein